MRDKSSRLKFILEQFCKHKWKWYKIFHRASLVRNDKQWKRDKKCYLQI